MAKPPILGTLFSISVILELKSVFTTKLLTSGILFSKASNYSLLAIPLPFFSIFSTFELSASYLVFKTNPVVSILSTFVTNLLCSVFLTTPFLLHYLILLNHLEQVLIYQYQNLRC